jgi:hypothetical protein
LACPGRGQRAHAGARAGPGQQSPGRPWSTPRTGCAAAARVRGDTRPARARSRLRTRRMTPAPALRARRRGIIAEEAWTLRGGCATWQRPVATGQRRHSERRTARRPHRRKRSKVSPPEPQHRRVEGDQGRRGGEDWREAVPAYLRRDAVSSTPTSCCGALAASEGRGRCLAAAERQPSKSWQRAAWELHQGSLEHAAPSKQEAVQMTQRRKHLHDRAQGRRSREIQVLHQPCPIKIALLIRRALRSPWG